MFIHTCKTRGNGHVRFLALLVGECLPQAPEHSRQSGWRRALRALFLSQISQDYVNNRLTGFLICVQPIYSAPLTYVALLLHGGVESYSNAVAEYKPYEN